MRGARRLRANAGGRRASEPTRRTLGEVRVVRRDDDRRATASGEAGEGLDDVGAGLRVEVAGRLVREDNVRLDRERARDCDALLLTAGRCDGRWVARSARPTSARIASDRVRSSSSVIPVGASFACTFSSAVSVGIRLNCWNTKPNERSRKSASSPSGSAARSRPSNCTRPEDGRSSAPSN